MKIVTESGSLAATSFAPLVSSSRSGTCPLARIRSSSERSVPYRCPETYSTCSRNSSASIRARNSSGVRNQYSRPFSSPGRRSRVVAETVTSTSGTHSTSSWINVPLPAPDGPVTTMTDGRPRLPIEEVNQLRALSLRQTADRLRLADAARVEEARRFHTTELRDRHEDVDHLCGLDVLGRAAEDRLDPYATVLEITLQLRTADANIVRALQCIHALVE